MKKIIIAISFAVLAGATPALAAEGPKEVFSQKFTGAENVKWTRLSGEYEKVSFTLGGTRAEAYFTSEGELLGSVRNLIYNQLPLAVMQTLSNQYRGAVVTEITEVNNADGTGYRIVFELKNKKYVVKMDNMGNLTELRKHRIRK
jgi:hypothetical protein